MSSLIKKFIELHSDSIIETAIKNCHCIGLHSFIIRTKPFKIRLFLADENCELRQPYDVENPHLTIHRHRHSSIFVPLTKTKIIHQLYRIAENSFDSVNCFSFSTNIYSRLNQKYFHGQTGGSDWLTYCGASSKCFLHAEEFHSVNILGNEKCAWLVIELSEANDFEQISYGGAKLTDGCYQKFDDPIKFITDFFR